jgi:mono/diheme cytochrome c family protein
MRFLLLPLLATTLVGQDLGVQAQAILQKNCVICHGAALQSAKLDLRTRDAMIRGGERGPALNPGHPEVSRLYLFASGTEQPSMPPGKTLAQEDLAVLRAWIKEGAKLDTVVEADTDRQAALAKLEERPILPEERAFWSFQPVKRPKAANIDELWLGALRAKGLVPNPPAAKRALIRRAYLDLIGLPATSVQIQKFLADSSPQAFSKVVEELLASPHYGERWGRHWLDLVRYSDSAGYEFDRDRPTAHLYRDWVIQSFNRDMPYDEFLRMQIAGDLTGQRDGIVAASYLRLGAEPNLKTEQTRMDELDDLLATTSNAMLGMTVGCARCHNHKFDPIPQKDYYRMQAVFFSGKPADIPLVGPEEIAKHKEALKIWNAMVEPTRQRKAEIEKPYRERLLQEKKDKLADYIKVALATPPEKRTEGQRLNAIQVEKTLRVEEKEVQAVLSAADRAKWDAVKAELEGFDKTKPILPTALGVEEKKIEPSYFLHHGSVDSKGSPMKPGVLSVACDDEWDFEGTNRRAAFADWIASPGNPLTARVMVNRIWQHHFGEGIVRSTSNFGKTGESPTHPELLDWLASEFIERGWSVKAMHRLILNSRAYQMSSDDRADGLKADPENRFLWRQARARLEGEILRDSILAVAGTLDTKMGGPGVHPFIDPSLWAGSSGRIWPGKSNTDPETWRRSIYIFQKRTIPVPMMELFDAPSGIVSCARRNRSTIATQALILMNNDFVLDQAKRFAARLEREAGSDPAAQVNLAFELALSRPPSAKELAESVTFLKEGSLADFAQTIFSLNEFSYAP